MEDSAIIDLYWAREERALTESDSKYGGMCRTIAFNILRDRWDSEECVNDTWLRAWNTMPPQRPGVLSAFLSRITRNLSLDRYLDGHTWPKLAEHRALQLQSLQCQRPPETFSAAVWEEDRLILTTDRQEYTIRFTEGRCIYESIQER